MTCSLYSPVCCTVVRGRWHRATAAHGQRLRPASSSATLLLPHNSLTRTESRSIRKRTAYSPAVLLVCLFHPSKIVLQYKVSICLKCDIVMRKKPQDSYKFCSSCNLHCLRKNASKNVFNISYNWILRLRSPQQIFPSQSFFAKIFCSIPYLHTLVWILILSSFLSDFRFLYFIFNCIKRWKFWFFIVCKKPIWPHKKIIHSSIFCFYLNEGKHIFKFFSTCWICDFIFFRMTPWL